jgi:LacI family transcriptional regulator
MPHMKRVLVLGHLDRQSTRSIVQGITKYANLYGPWVFYHRIPFYKTPDACGERFISQEAYESELRGLLENGHIDGIVAEMASGSAAERILPRGFPAVLIPVQEPVAGYINLVSSGDETGQMAADYLRNLGFRHIAFFGLPHVYWSQRREQSFCRGLEAHGVTPFVFQQQCSAGPFCWTEELEEITGALRTLPRPLAVWAWNDDLAARVIEACRTLNDAVPDEVCILGTDNDELFCSLCDPPLSSIALNFERAGYEMAEALEALMAGQAPSTGEIELTPLHVVERQSTETQAVD